MKIVQLSVLALLISVSSYAQKPKKTYNSEKFVQKVQFSMTPDLIGKWLPDDAALQYIAGKSEKTLGELRGENKINTENIKKDADEFIKKGLAYILDKSEVQVKQENPVKIADIVLYCHTKENKFTIKLSNCVQTNISWYLGDAIILEGDGFESVVSAKADKKPSKFGAMLVKAGEIQKNAEDINKKNQAIEDSLRKARPGYETKNRTYYNHDMAELPLSGYYIMNNGEKVTAIIAYLKPQFLMGLSTSLFICKQVTGKKVDYLNANLETNFKEWVKYGDIKAFFVADQLYVKNSDGAFTTLISEGAIHTTTSAKLINGKTQHFKVFPVTQKLNGQKFGSVSNGVTEATLLNMMSDAPGIIKGYKNGEYTLNEAEIRYNIWYEENNPGKINYIFGKDYEVTKKSSATTSKEVTAYEKEVVDKYDQAHTVPKQDLFAGRPLDPSDAIASAKPEVKVKKESFLDRLNRIKTDGNNVGVLVRCENIYVNPGDVGEGITKVKVVGSYAPLERTEKLANKVTDEFNKGFGVNVFEAVDYSLISVKEGTNGKMDDWWSTKYKMIVIYDIIPSYTAIRRTNNSTGEKEFRAQMKVNTQVIVMSAEDKQQSRLKYVTSSPSTWGYYKTEPFIGTATTNFDIIQDLKEVINPPADAVVIEELIKSQQKSIDKFIKKKSK